MLKAAIIKPVVGLLALEVHTNRSRVTFSSDLELVVWLAAAQMNLLTGQRDLSLFEPNRLGVKTH